MYEEAKEFKIPVALTVVGFALLLARAYVDPQGAGMLTAFINLVIATAVGVALGIGACFLAARVLDTSFGFLSSAIYKLTGTFTFTAGVAGAVGGPWGWFLSLPIYFGLLSWLFELDMLETIVFTLILWVMLMSV